MITQYINNRITLNNPPQTGLELEQNLIASKMLRKPPILANIKPRLVWRRNVVVPADLRPVKVSTKGYRL